MTEKPIITSVTHLRKEYLVIDPVTNSHNH